MKSGGTIASLFTDIDIKLDDSASLLKKVNKLSAKKKAKRIKILLDDNSFSIARFYLYPKDTFIGVAIGSKMTAIFRALYSEDVFFNYKPGLLKNYFQKINTLLKKEELYWMYEDDYSPELKKLAGNKLYVPSYIAIQYTGWTRKDSEADNKTIEELFKKYEYHYQIISDEELSDQILHNEEFYYLRYVRMNA
jgi:hypothetical protein